MRALGHALVHVSIAEAVTTMSDKQQEKKLRKSSSKVDSATLKTP